MTIIDCSTPGQTNTMNVWSNNSALEFNLPPYITGSVYNGLEEFFIKNTSGCNAQITADAIFDDPDGTRIVIGSLATVVANANARMASMPAPYNTYFLSLTGTTIKLNNAPYCFKLKGTAKLGDIGVCAGSAASTTTINRVDTGFTPLNT